MGPIKAVENIIPKLNSPEKIYELFKEIGYSQVLDPSYRRKIDEFDFAKDEREKIKNIYTVFNLEGKLQIFLFETSTLSNPLIKYLTKRLTDRYLKFLLILTSDYREYSFVFPEFERIEEGKHRLKLTRLNLDRDNSYHTDLLTITNIALSGDEKTWRDIWNKWKEAFRVEKVTKRFFEDYKDSFFELRSAFEDQGIPIKKAHELSQQFLNRLMFLYFIAKKRWLNDDPRFIRWYWERYREEKRKGKVQDNTFYEDWLRILFLEAFNNRYSHPSCHPEDIKHALVLAPYLNGGLFSRNDLDNLVFYISDGLFEKVFNFFEKYNFTIREDLPLDVEVAVDPQMIGYVYESLSNVAEEIYERQDLGIFYTPTVEVDFMCRRSLVEYVANQMPDLQKEWIYSLLFDEDKKDVEEFYSKKSLWYRLEEALDNLAVIDPACGSGAFLVGMLHVLAELYRLAYTHINREMTEFELKKKIIGNSLYGVDVMPWAVHSAELRLWLQLIIEEDIPAADRKLFPLLPNLNLRLRIGDSLVQEVGGISLHIRDSILSSQLKRKLNNLKIEKEKYYNNDPTAKFKSDSALLHEEHRIFSEIIDEKISALIKERDEVFKGQDNWLNKKQDVEGKLKQKKDAINDKIETLIQIKNRFQAPGQKPFVWDIDFAEIFGDKGGFDIVIGNPPYVRQEKIAPPNRLKGEVTLEEKREYKDKLLKSIQVHYPFIKKLDKKSDYYIYFYFHGLSLLNDKGTFCFITSNSWLDVGYGRGLQEFLLKYCHIKAIYDNEAKRSFEHADVNTIMALFSPLDASQPNILWPGIKNTARFVMFKKPFEEAVNTKNLLAIEKAETIQRKDAYRVYPIKQEALLEDGWEEPEASQESEDRVWKTEVRGQKSEDRSQKTDVRRGKLALKGTLLRHSALDAESRFAFSGRYEGNKWGGKYLRAPDIFFTILEKGKGKLVRLGDIAEVRFGIKTGCNEFFYLPNKHFDIKKEGCYYALIPKSEKYPEHIKIEKEYLTPVIISPRDVDRIAFGVNDIGNFVFFCNAEAKKKSAGVQQYIKFGEKLKLHLGSTLRARNPWWQIKEHRNSKLIWAMMHARRHNVHFNTDGCEVDHNFFEIIPGEIDLSENLAGQATSTLLIFIKELFGRAYGGGSGPIKNEGVDIVQYLFINPKTFQRDKQYEFVKLFENISTREIKDVYEEFGINLARPIREQMPNPLPDRKALDDIIFDVIGLTEDERNEVYWSVCELVRNRLEKARSV